MSELDRPTSAVVEVRIRVHQGPATGKTFTVKNYPAVIGRGQDCDVRLDDRPEQPTMSRHHARLLLEGGRIILRDLSTNGTWVDSHQLERGETAVLTGEQSIWLGSETLITVDFRTSARVPMAAAHPAAQRREVEAPRGVPGGPLEPPTAPVNTLSVQALGPFAVAVNRVPIPETNWASQRSMVLFIYLAEQLPHGVPTERLVDTLWSDNRGTRQAVQTAASRLRQALRGGREDIPDPLRFSHNQYGLNEAYHIDYDARSFELGCKAARKLWSGGTPQPAEKALQDALTYYRGEFLPAATENWIVRRRTALEHLHADAARALAAMLEQRGDASAALTIYQKLVQEPTAPEAAHEGVIRCLGLLGHRDEALRQYQASIGELRRLLDVAPGRSMIELREALVGGSTVAPAVPFD